VIVQFGTEVTL